MLGNVKAFILSICGAVVFATLLVSANTMAMSIRERTREVAVLKTLGFTRKTVLALFVGEAVVVAVLAGMIGLLIGSGLMYVIGHNPQAGFFQGIGVNVPTMILAVILAGLVGFVAALFPSYNASRVDIVEGLRYIG
jgi:putative ABC transport system permease protein